ncbi:unnamed protein product [Brassica oleracea]
MNPFVKSLQKVKKYELQRQLKKVRLEITLCWSRLETEVNKNKRAGHHVGHRERSSVSDTRVPHVNSPVAGIRIRVEFFITLFFFPDLSHTKIFSQAMNFNSKYSVSGDFISKKPNGKDGVSSAEPIKSMDSNSKSPASGDLISKKPNGKNGVSSVGPIKRTGQTGVASAKAVSGDPMSKKSTGKAVVCSDVPGQT